MLKKIIPFVLFLMIYPGLIKADSYDYIVAQDGSGDFTKIQDVIFWEWFIKGVRNA